MDNKAWVDNLDKAILENEQKEKQKKAQNSKPGSGYSEYISKIKRQAWKRVGITTTLVIILCLTMHFLHITGVIGGSTQQASNTSLTTGTHVGLQPDIGAISVRPIHITVDIGEQLAELNIDSSNKVMQGFSNYGGYGYIGYTNTAQSEYAEIIITNSISTSDGLSSDTLDKLETADSIVSEQEVDDTLGIIINKSAKKLTNTSYIIVIQQESIYNTEEAPDETEDKAEDSLETKSESILNELLDNLKFTNKQSGNEHLYLDFSGLGTIDLIDIQGLKNIGCYTSNGILTIYDYETNKDIMIITGVDNSNIGNNGESLRQSDELVNLYYPDGYDDSESNYYRAFAIQTNSGAYYFQMAPDTQEGLEESIVSLMGLSKRDNYIQPSF